ncbi:hypothetical protein [Streptomyces lydicus]|uniref:hypothetical protein n=1 Tax=Streptomyces lydicus TaxID=47763 RepID=UPI00378881A6
MAEAALNQRAPKPTAAPSEDLSGEINILENRIRGLRKRWKAGEMEDEDYFD